MPNYLYKIFLIGSYLIISNSILSAETCSYNKTYKKTDTLKTCNYKDGPYIKWNSKRKIKALYLFTTKESERVRMVRKKFRVHSNKYILNGFNNDTNKYYLHYDNNIESSNYQGVEKLFVMGDIHGEYLPMIEMLKYNNVIDEKLKWIFGEGHLVFTGDIFDKGNYVTECLWFIYNLEQEAEKAGGKVHLVLGTHEFLELNNFNGYLTDKYNFLFTKKYRYYSSYYSKKYILGKWLRTKNILLIVNNILFVHGGISPEFFDLNLNIDEANLLARKYLDNPFKYKKRNNVKVLIGKSGPYWYRGFNKDKEGNYGIDENYLNRIMKFYNVEKIIFGHTEMKKIKPTFNGKLINVDIPFGKKEIESEALLITPNGYFRVFPDKPAKLIY